MTSVDTKTGRGPRDSETEKALIRHRSIDRTRTRQLLLYAAILVLVLAVVGAAIGAIFGPRDVAYEARVVVGSRDLSAQQVPFYSTATVSLAETYARYVTEEDGVDLPFDVTVTASVIADTPVVRIQATAPVEDNAKRAAQQVAENLVTEVNEGSTSRTTGLADAIADLSRRLSELNIQADALEAAGDTDELVRVQTDIRLAELELDALSTAYREALTTEVNPATQLSIIQSAYRVTETAPRPVLVGALAGALVGGLATLGLFTLRARRPPTQ